MESDPGGRLMGTRLNVAADDRAGLPRFSRGVICLIVTAATILPTGCASQRGQMSSKRGINTAQFLAAARQYEKEGQVANAAKIYKHVLRLEPSNAAAREGLALVQQGKLRVTYNTDELLATSSRPAQQHSAARAKLARQRKQTRQQINAKMAQLIVEAAENPRVVKVDATPSEVLVASKNAAAESQRRLEAVAAVEAKPRPQVATAAEPKPTPRSEPIARSAPLAVITPKPTSRTTITQANGMTSDFSRGMIETTAFAGAKTLPGEADSSEAPMAQEILVETTTPVDWAENDRWTAHSLTNKCHDADAAILAVVKDLEQNADAVRREALEKLAQMGPEAKSAAPAIRQLLADQNQLVAAYAAWAVWEVEGDSRSAVHTLRGLLNGPSTNVIQFASYTLGTIGPAAKDAAWQLSILLNHDDSLTRLHAAEALTLITENEHHQKAVDTLLMLLQDQDAHVRSLAALTLEQVGEAGIGAAVMSLVTALDDEEAAVRSAAALSLGAFEALSLPALDKLQRTYETDYTDVRKAAETTLFCISR